MVTSKTKTDIELRALRANDNPLIAAVIRDVLREHGLDREGFAFVDPELDSMYAHYQAPAAAYLVLSSKDGKKLLGGGGFAHLEGGDAVTAELKKMYFRPEVRGLGYGRTMIESLLASAQAAGYQQIYLETVEEMLPAIALYEKVGFQKLRRPLGQTGHTGCNVWMLRNLR